MSGGKADLNNATEALLALGSKEERAAYQQELAKPPEQDECGQEIIDNFVQNLLLPKASAIANIVLIFESFDKILPLSEPKKVFFHKATEELGLAVPTAWMKQAWTKATLHPSRRLAGVKSN